MPRSNSTENIFAKDSDLHHLCMWRPVSVSFPLSWHKQWHGASIEHRVVSRELLHRASYARDFRLLVRSKRETPTMQYRLATMIRIERYRPAGIVADLADLSLRSILVDPSGSSRLMI